MAKKRKKADVDDADLKLEEESADAVVVQEEPDYERLKVSIGSVAEEGEVLIAPDGSVNGNLFSAKRILISTEALTDSYVDLVLWVVCIMCAHKDIDPHDARVLALDEKLSEFINAGQIRFKAAFVRNFFEKEGRFFLD